MANRKQTFSLADVIDKVLESDEEDLSDTLSSDEEDMQEEPCYLDSRLNLLPDIDENASDDDESVGLQDQASDLTEPSAVVDHNTDNDATIDLHANENVERQQATSTCNSTESGDSDKEN